MNDDQLLDDRLIQPLLEQSQDIHSDAMAAAEEPLAGLVELGQEARAHGEVETVDMGRVQTDRWDGLSKTLAGAGGLVAATGIGAALLSLFATPAFASTSKTAGDIMILQTAASIEVLAIQTYTTALTLPYIGGSTANKVVTAFVKETVAQHTAHREAFNSASRSLGGKEQTKPDPAFTSTVSSAVASLGKLSTSKATLAVVGLALTLENVAAETYSNDMSHLSSSAPKMLMASVMGIEAQHVAVLLAVQALLEGGAGNLIAIPTNDAKLPAAAGKVGFPNAFYSVANAAPASQGAVK